MKILIIGNQGYVGSVLVEELKSKRKYKLLGLDLGIFSKNLVSNYNPDDLLDEQIIQDVRNFDISLLFDIFWEFLKFEVKLCFVPRNFSGTFI